MTTTSPLPSIPTLLGPLTTIFTPPQSCLGYTAACELNLIPHEFYTGGHANSAQIDKEHQHPECYPPGYPALEQRGFFVGYATTVGTLGPYYSPGVCPASYVTAFTEVLGHETRAICCISHLSFDSTKGCFSNYTTPVTHPLTRTASEYFVFNTIGDEPHPIIASKVTEEDPDLYGSVIEIRWQASDLSSQMLITSVPPPTVTPPPLTITSPPVASPIPIYSPTSYPNLTVTHFSIQANSTASLAPLTNSASDSSSGNTKAAMKFYVMITASALLLYVWRF